VSLILDIFHWRVENNAAVLRHIARRLADLIERFSIADYNAYRAEIARLEYGSTGKNMEFLPGLLLNMPAELCYDIALALESATYADLVPEATDTDTKEIFAALTSLQNQSSYIAIHSGKYLVESNADGLLVTAGDDALAFAPIEQPRFKQQEANVTFYLSAAATSFSASPGFSCQRERSQVGWAAREWRDRRSLDTSCRCSKRASGLTIMCVRALKWPARFITRSFPAPHARAAPPAERSSSTGWHRRMNFTAVFKDYQRACRYDASPHATFSRLFREFLTEDEFDGVVRRSIAYGIGFNIGALCRQWQRGTLLDGSQFKVEIAATYKILERAKSEFRFFYIEGLGDGWELPRYYF
jgi:hypothetical protein